jgi:hypothetical protein
VEKNWGIAEVLTVDEDHFRPSRLAFALFVSLIVLLFLSVAVARPAHALGNDDGVAVTRLDDDDENEGEDDEDDEDTDSGSGDEEEQAAREEAGEGTKDTDSGDVQGNQQQQANGTKDTDSGDVQGNQQQQANGTKDTDSGGDVEGANQGEDTDTSSDQGEAGNGGNGQGEVAEDDVLGNEQQRGPGGAGPDVLGTRFGRGPAVAPGAQVAGRAQGQVLPFTGIELAAMLAAAAGFVTSGAYLVRRRRR